MRCERSARLLTAFLTILGMLYLPHPAGCGSMTGIADLGRILNLAPGRKLLALLSAYLDCSMRDQPPGVTSVAGYVAPISEWERVEREWKHGLSHRQWKIDRFRLSDLPYHVGDANAELCARYFAQIIMNSAVHAIGSALLNCDWRRTNWSMFNMPRYDTLYEQCLDMALNTLGNHTNKYFPGERVVVICCPDGSKGDIVKVFERLKQNYPQFITISVASSSDVVPLQCADLGAGRLRNSWKSIINDEPDTRELDFGTMPYGKDGEITTSFWSLIPGAVLERARRIAMKQGRE